MKYLLIITIICFSLNSNASNVEPPVTKKQRTSKKQFSDLKKLSTPMQDLILFGKKRKTFNC